MINKEEKNRMNYYCKLCDQSIENLYEHLRDEHKSTVDDYLDQMRANFVPVKKKEEPEKAEPNKENYEPTFNFHK